ncbi:hypothetical protein [Flavobacterium sp. ov086]|uniref:hypothetical protein n=1 Tax=Flavobacterium sp. ov086 TaxID=1761785 RepID=UPI000B70F77D|nr:hypothetical protein [Flavobacterium sp. ov086]SNR40037.1 hypothetical protein SAMN04487979_1058 [Flavobacterium sp. ov086]
MKFFTILAISIFFFSCQQKENKKTSVSTSDSIITKKIKEEKKDDNQQIGDTIFLKLKDEKGLFVANGSLDSIHSRIYVKFKNENISELKAKIIPAPGKGNIRFNQIIFPDKSSDGPFGMDLSIHLTQKGNHILVIGHSLMADNPYWGKFKVEVENQN